jgi:hypothetical protein
MAGRRRLLIFSSVYVSMDGWIGFMEEWAFVV